jgi:hypothetical protein
MVSSKSSKPYEQQTRQKAEQHRQTDIVLDGFNMLLQETRAPGENADMHKADESQLVNHGQHMVKVNTHSLQNKQDVHYIVCSQPLQPTWCTRCR